MKQVFKLFTIASITRPLPIRHNARRWLFPTRARKKSAFPLKRCWMKYAGRRMKTGVTRISLARALAADGPQELDSILPAVINALSSMHNAGFPVDPNSPVEQQRFLEFLFACMGGISLYTLSNEIVKSYVEGGAKAKIQMKKLLFHGS